MRSIHAAALACLVAPASGLAVERVRVAYFLEWPTPNLVAKAAGTYAAALGVPVTWVAFDTGTQMTEAMRAGDIDIAYGHGLAPFVAAIDEGVPLVLAGIALEYPANDCVIRDGSGIDPDEPDSFAGRSVALPVATTADYTFRAMADALGFDAGAMTVIDRIPSEAAVALLDAEVDLACGFGAVAMAKMRTAGPLLMDDGAKRAADISAFDVVSATADFARESPRLVEAFLDVTAEANATWTGSRDQLAAVALESGLTPGALLGQLDDFSFPTPGEQRDRLLAPDGPVPAAMTLIGEAFATDASREAPDYAATIDPTYLPD